MNFRKSWWLLKEPFFVISAQQCSLTSKPVQGSSLTFQCVHHVHCSHRLALGVFRVSNSVTDNVLEEDFQNSTCFFVDESGDSLHTASASKTSDGWLGYALDVITKDLPVALSASFSKSFTSFTATRHSSLYYLSASTLR